MKFMSTSETEKTAMSCSHTLTDPPVDSLDDASKTVQVDAGTTIDLLLEEKTSTYTTKLSIYHFHSQGGAIVTSHQPFS